MRLAISESRDSIHSGDELETNAWTLPGGATGGEQPIVNEQFGREDIDSSSEHGENID